MTLCQLSAAEFQCNDKKHAVTDCIPFKLNFGRHPWKENLTVKIELLLWQPLDTQGPMISLTSKPQRRSIMWEFTREPDKESLLNYHPIYTKYI